MDPIHDTRRQFGVRFYLLAIAFLVFDVEVLFLYPWAVASRPASMKVADVAPGDAVAEDESGASAAASRGLDAAVGAGPAKGFVDGRDTIFVGVMLFLALLVAGYVYDWRKGVFHWR
jgi:NADH-quinone oxidoreductase subunit A